jgi:hypothetical protein
MEDVNIRNMLTAINCPFDFNENPKYADGYPTNTLALLDFFDDNGIVTPINNNGTDYTITGVGCVYVYGNNFLTTNLYCASDGLPRDEKLYTPIYFYIGEGGTVINFNGSGNGLGGIAKSSMVLRTVKKNTESLKVNANPLKEAKAKYDEKYDEIIVENGTKKNKVKNLDDSATAYWWTYDTANYETLFGIVNGYSAYDTNVVGMRLNGAGIRFWPIIEEVTNSETIAVSRYYCFQTDARSLSTCASVSSNVYTLAKDSQNYAEYPNRKGASARVQVYQRYSGLSMYEMTSLDTLSDGSLDTNSISFPCIIARLTQTVSLSSGDFYTFPVRSAFRQMFEGKMVTPSPYVATRPPFNPDWERYLAMYTNNTLEYPVSVSGHSFKKILKGAVNLLGNNTVQGRQIMSIVKQVNAIKNDVKRGNLKSAIQNTGRVSRKVYGVARQGRKLFQQADNAYRNNNNSLIRAYVNQNGDIPRGFNVIGKAAKRNIKRKIKTALAKQQQQFLDEESKQIDNFINSDNANNIDTELPVNVE